MPSSGGMTGKTAAPSGTWFESWVMSTPGHRGNDANLIAVLDAGLQAVQVANVLVVDVDIHEPADLPVFENAAGDAGIFRAEVVEQVLDRGPGGFDDRLVLRVLPHGSGDIDADGHW